MTKHIDLHIHSTASDGSFSPAEIVKMSKENNLSAIALTDHDTIDGIERFLDEAKRSEIESIPGVEIGVSNDRERGMSEVHLLGYFVDSYDSPIGKALKKLQKAKSDWSEKQLEALSKAGFEVTTERVSEISKGSPAVRRPHIWQALNEKYGESLQREDYYQNTSFGGKWFVEKALSYSIEEATELILQSRGIPILAHPALYGEWPPSLDSIPEAIDKILEIAIKAGVCGFEAVYAYDSIEHISLPPEKVIQKHLFRKAESRKLCKTGGSDFHGEISKSVKLGQAMVPYNLLDELRDKFKEVHGLPPKQ
jgi:hypothetical protein